MAPLTLEQLSGALRLGDGSTTPEEPLLAILTRLQAVSVARVERYAPDADDETKSEAAVRLASALFDAPASAGTERYANLFRSSGAEALLAPWRQWRAVTGVVIERTD